MSIDPAKSNALTRSLVVTLDELVERDASEAELWAWIAKPEDLRQQHDLLRHWRWAKRQALTEQRRELAK